ncbi:hypothetical protein FJ651_15620 [Paucihalobacter ruber]|uniref:Lipoprotein n=1 Tax=Paucihalobacter ruber TaxID=2567861 RepID=A0A506PDF6_9FLAO|nr:hypothetical protein [Paucihalobacter ruber]TPV31047.1 hypothetical protein FJ651_15620 [Paucihalobacter ruber]
MVEVIKVSRSLSSIVVLLLLLSCSASKLNENKKRTISIIFGSVYENEKLTLSVNDSVYYSDRDIKTNSLGTDPKNYIEIESDKVHLKGYFMAKIDPEFDKDYTRKLEIDTILYRKKGRLISIGANYHKYYINQQNKKFKVE